MISTGDLARKFPLDSHFFKLKKINNKKRMDSNNKNQVTAAFMSIALFLPGIFRAYGEKAGNVKQKRAPDLVR